MAHVSSWIKTLSAGTLMSLLGLAAVMLVWRRLAGALQEPLELPALAITACALAAAGASIRLLRADAFAARASERWWRDRLILLAPTVAIMAVGCSLSVPGTSAASLAVLWILIAVGEICSFVWRVSFRSPATIADLDAVPLENTIDERVTQQLVRMRDRGGGESMSGLLKANFSAGQRTATVHVAFCPPFSALPKMEVEQADGPPGRIKTVQLLPYGARFDIKLSSDAEEPLAVSLRFSAKA